MTEKFSVKDNSLPVNLQP